MMGEPMDIIFKDNAVPYAVHIPIRVPIFWEEMVYRGLKRDERLDVIEEIPDGTPTT